MIGPGARFGRSLAVVVGIDVYGDRIASLRSAVSDAVAIAATLESDHGFEVRLLCNDEARLAALRSLLDEELPTTLSENDRLLFYFAGHGIAIDSDRGPAGYLVPARASRTPTSEFLPMRDVSVALSKLPIRHVLVVLDCCFAGAFRWESTRDLEPERPTRIYRERYDRYVERPAWQLLASTSADALAFDMLADDRGGDARSPFARAFLDGLAGAADYTRDNLITADELAIYVRENVAPAAEAIGRRQLPQLASLERDDGGQFVFQVPNTMLALERAPPPDKNPYRGLDAFTEEDEAKFFGRDAAIADLVDTVKRQRLTVVVGPSGCGKSSLVRAGLVAKLRDTWNVLPTERPGRDPVSALSRWQRELRTGGDQERDTLIIVDQLEELFTYRIEDAVRADFLTTLANALTEMARLRLVVTVRADAEPGFLDSPLSLWWSAARFTVPAMSTAELREVITKPATASVLHFDPPRLVERLIVDVAIASVPLPLLSFVLGELYDRCWARWQAGEHDRALRETDYDRDMGSVAASLSKRATALYDTLVAESDAYATTIRNVFTRMVAVVNGELARRRVFETELVFGDVHEDVRVRDVLQRFGDARLIARGAERPDDRRTAYAEPMHDALVRGWTKVDAWLRELDEPEGTRGLIAAVGIAAQAWAPKQKETELLWLDARIELLTARSTERLFLLNALEMRFVQESARFQDSQRRNEIKRKKRILGGITVAATLIAIAVVVVFWVGHQRSIEESRALGLQAIQRADIDPRSAAMDAIRARGLAHTRESMDALRKTLLVPRKTAAVFTVKVGLGAIHVVGGGAYVAKGRDGSLWKVTRSGVASQLLEGRTSILSRSGGHALVLHDGAWNLLDNASGRIIWDRVNIPQDGTPDAFDVSEDGHWMVVCNGHTPTTLWDISTRQISKTLSPSSDVVFFRKDARAAIGLGKDVFIWNAATNTLQVLPRPPELEKLEYTEEFEHIAVSADGRYVAGGGLATVVLWDLQELSRGIVFAHDAPIISGEPLPVHAIAFDPHGKFLAAAGKGRTLRIWNVPDRVPHAVLRGHTEEILTVVFSHDGKYIATVSSDGSARIWAAQAGVEVAELMHANGIRDAQFTDDDSSVVTSDLDGYVTTWQALPIVPTLRLDCPGDVADLRFDLQGNRLITRSNYEASFVWDLESRKHMLDLKGLHSPKITSAEFSPDGQSVLITDKEGSVVIRSVVNGELKEQHDTGSELAIFGAPFADIISHDKDGLIRLWKIGVDHQWTELKSLQPKEGWIRAIRSVPAHSALILAGLHGVEVFDFERGEFTSPKDGGSAFDIAVEPHEKVFAAVGMSAVVDMWSLPRLSQAGSMVGHSDHIFSVDFSPDGRWLVTGSADSSVRIWNVERLEILTTLYPSNEYVYSVRFSPDGRRLAVGDTAGYVYLYDVPQLSDDSSLEAAVRKVFGDPGASGRP